MTTQNKVYYLFEFPQEVEHYLATGDPDAALTCVNAKWMRGELRDLMKEYSQREYTYNPLYLAHYSTQEVLLVKLRTVTELVLDEIVACSLPGISLKDLTDNPNIVPCGEEVYQLPNPNYSPK